MVQLPLSKRQTSQVEMGKTWQKKKVEGSVESSKKDSVIISAWISWCEFARDICLK